ASSPSRGLDARCASVAASSCAGVMRPRSSRNWPRNLTAIGGAPWFGRRAGSGQDFTEHALHDFRIDRLLQVGAGTAAQAVLDVALGTERAEDHHLRLLIVLEDPGKGRAC